MKILYSTFVILDPKWGLSSSSKRKLLKICDQSFSIGKSVLLYSQVVDIRLEKFCIYFVYEETHYRFGVQERVGAGKVSFVATSMLYELLLAGLNNNSYLFQQYLDALKIKKRSDSFFIFCKLLLIVILGLSFGYVYTWYLDNPFRLIILPLLLIGGNFTITIFFRLFERKRFFGLMDSHAWNVS